MIESSFQALGTTITVSLNEADSKRITPLIENEALRIDHKFSRFLPSSALSRVNQNLHKKVEVDAEFLFLLKHFKTLEPLTSPYLSLATTALLEHWGYDKNYNLKATAREQNFAALQLRVKDNTVCVNQPIDFGCFGKGYFLDQARQILSENHAKEFIINAGGDITFSLNRSVPFYLEDPRITSRYIGECHLQTGFLCASAANRRQWGPFHHLIDAPNQQPADGMQAVYVQSQANGLITDALSTALFVMGFEKAIDCMARLKLDFPSIESLLISATGKIWRSNHFKGELYRS